MRTNKTRIDWRLAGALIGLAALPCIALANDLASDPGDEELFGIVTGSMNGGVDLWGDDTIGVLPIHGPPGGGGTSVIPSMADLILGTSPSFFIEGNVGELKRLIADAGGQGDVLVLPVEDPDSARVVFRGDVTVDLQRSLVGVSNVDFGLYSGLPVEKGVVVMEYTDIYSEMFMIYPSVPFQIDLERFELTGTLQQAPLEASVHIGQRAPSTMTFSSSGALLTVDQFTP